MKNLCSTLLRWGLSLSLALTTLQPAQAQDLQTVVNAHVQAMGGEVALRQLKTLQMDASTRYLLFKLSVRSVIVHDEGVSRSVYSGREKVLETVATARGGHEIDDKGKRKPMDPREAADAFKDTDLSGPFVDTEKKGIALQLLGQRVLKSGVKTHVVEVRRRGQEPQRHFIRVDDHMVVRIEDKNFNAEKSVWEEDATDFDDYRSVGGIKLPFLIRDKDGDALNVSSYKINEPVDPAVFK